ncbi:MAG: energy transducer TonB [Gemmatimonadetes bacterium]|nr:energy transducer TonB [Gemmatimonadota bacterium]
MSAAADSTVTTPSQGLEARFETANDRFKKSFGAWFAGSIILASLFHFALFNYWPAMTAQDISFTAEELEAVELPPEIEIPPPPQAIARPGTPVVAETAVEEDITIAPTTFSENPVENLPPPPSQRGGGEDEELAAAPRFTPMTVRPDILNRDEVGRALEREYPPLLRDAGIGGTVVVWFFIDEEGRVQRTQVAKSSGHKALDEAAIRVADLYRFSPAMNRDKKVKVWVQIPVTFKTR